MAASEITGLTELAAAPADDDELVIVDVSDTTQSANGSTKRLAASRVARTGTTNTFTAAQEFGSGATGGQVAIKAGNASTVGLVVDTAASPSTSAMQIKNNGGNAITFSANRVIATWPFDNGSGVGGYILIERNNNASTPAAGFLRMVDKGAQAYSVWPDDSGVLRIGTSFITNANDTSGTVVGTQTSWHALKENITEWDGVEALDAIRSLTLYSYQMIQDGQKTPDGDKPTYHGIVIMDEDRESNAWFGLGYAENQIPVLNNRNLFGYILAAIRHGGDIIEELQTKVAALEARIAALEDA